MNRLQSLSRRPWLVALLLAACLGGVALIAAGALTLLREVLRYAPEGEISLAPFLNVTFNQPMVPLASLDALSAEEVPVQLDPPLPGTWRWIGTKTLRFEYASDLIDRLPKATEYVATVPAGTRSATGGVLAEAVSWTFRTPPPVMTSSYPSGDAQPLEPLILVAFDQRIDPPAVLATVRVTAGGQPVAIRLASDEAVQEDEAVARLARNAGEGRWLAFMPAVPLPADTTIEVIVGPGAPSAEGPLVTADEQRFSFRTYAPLRIQEHGCTWEYNDECRPFTPLYVQFNNPIDTDAYQETMLAIEPAVPGATVNVVGDTITIKGATAGRTTYEITIAASIQDVFGQQLGKDTRLTVRVGPAEQMLIGPNEALITLDPAAKEPNLTVYTVNFDRLRVRAYEVGPADWSRYKTYLQDYYRQGGKATPPGREVMDQTTRIEAAADALTEVTVNLNPALSGKTGHLVVIIEPPSLLDLGNRDPYGRVVQVWVQVTQIGLDAFVDHSEMVVWTTALQDGAPLDGVTLEADPGNQVAVTANGGVARFPLADGTTDIRTDILIARQGDDWAILPQSPYMWGEGGWQNGRFRTRCAGSSLTTAPCTGRAKRSTSKGGSAGWAGPRPVTSGSSATRIRRPLRGHRSPGQPARHRPGRDQRARRIRPPVYRARQRQPRLRPTDPRCRQCRRACPAPATITAFRFRNSAGPSSRSSPATRPSAPTWSAVTRSWPSRPTISPAGPLPNAEANWQVTSSPGSYAPPNWPDFIFGTWSPGGSTAGRSTTCGTIPSRIRKRRSKPMAASPTPPVSTICGSTLTRPTPASHGACSPRPRSWMSTARPGPQRPVCWSTRPSSTSACAASEPSSSAGRRSRSTSSSPTSTAYPCRPDIDRGPRRPSRMDGPAGRLARGRGRRPECTLASAAEPVTCTFETEVGGKYQITAVVADGAGRHNQSQFTRWVSGGARPPARQVEQETVELIPDRESYQPGDIAEILVQSPFGAAEGLLTVSRSGILYTNAFRWKGTPQSCACRSRKRTSPTSICRSTWWAARRGPTTAANPCQGPAATGLRHRPAHPRDPTAPPHPGLEVAPPRGRARAGRRDHSRHPLTDADGRPVAGAELAVVVVDEAILALTNYQLADPLAVFYQTDQPTSSYYGRASIVLANPEQLADEASRAGAVERERSSSRKGRWPRGT
jgi:alpha-2-macroglobulin